LTWLYGDGPEEHLHHVAACAHCQAVAVEHADTLQELVERASEPRSRRHPARLLLSGSLLAAAAALLLVVYRAPVQESEEPTLQDSDAPLVVEADRPSFRDELDQELATLDAQLAWMSVELATPPSQE